MKNKIYSKLWIYFSCLIFFMLVFFAIFIVFLLYFLMQLHVVTPGKGNQLLAFSLLLAFSILVGTLASTIVSRRILAPIKELTENMSKVATGDFSVQVNPSQKVEEIQQLFSDFNLMVAELNSIETLRNDFVANVSHEFKTPIATMQGYIQLLQQGHLSEADTQDYYSRIAEGAQQLTTLSNNILRLTKLETQSIPLEQQVFRIDEQIREVILFLQPQWEEKQLALDLHLPRTTYPGNEELLYQVWLNLMDNAIKYSRPKETVTVSLEEEPQQLVISFIDRGIAIPVDETKHIFDKFYQGDTSRKTAGNGLGLTLVKEILQLHEGRVAAKTLANQQTCFTVYLPKNH